MNTAKALKIQRKIKLKSKIMYFIKYNNSNYIYY